MKKRLIVIVFVVLLVGVGLMVYLGQRNVRLKELYYSGTIEAKDAELAFQVSGRVTRVLVEEGEAVEKGQVLAEIMRSEFLARKKQAQANLETAIKSLDRLELVLEITRNTLPADVERAKAGLDALRAQLEEAESGYRDQDVEQARQTLMAAKATMDEAKKDRERHESLFRDGIITEKAYDVAALKQETATREYERTKEKYAQLKEGFRKETIETSKARLAEGTAVMKQAESNLKKIETAEKDVEVARTQVEVARAGLELAEIQLQYTQLLAPFNGIITSRNVEPGEVVSPGREVLSLTDLSIVDLKIFVGETEIGKVKPGQKVEVRIDTFPNKAYWGKVAYVSPEGEFTPKIIQTHKERVKIVYLVKVSVPNPDFELKSGMPADAWLR